MNKCRTIYSQYAFCHANRFFFTCMLLMNREDCLEQQSRQVSAQPQHHRLASELEGACLLSPHQQPQPLDLEQTLVLLDLAVSFCTMFLHIYIRYGKILMSLRCEQYIWPVFVIVIIMYHADKYGQSGLPVGIIISHIRSALVLIVMQPSYAVYRFSSPCSFPIFVSCHQVFNLIFPPHNMTNKS